MARHFMDEVQTILRGEEGWPPSLSSLRDAPERLRVRGALGGPGARRVAVVGARAADAYGVEVARAIGRDLARARVWVVSGGAEGIDAAAHEGALEGGGPTLAVLGTGIDVVYPASHAGLFRRIVSAGGGLVSEYDDGQPAAPWTFPRRNRIVSGLGEAVVVVRAGRGSGALITAACALRQGVPVFAVPGDVTHPLSEGPLQLLRQGARVAAGASDVLEALGITGQLELPGAAQRAGTSMGPAEAAAYGALSRAPRHADEVARAAGLGAGPALAALLMLEIQGLCEQRPGHYFLRRT